MKVCFETFGCRLNRAEALQLEADYLANGWTTTNSHNEADLIIVRGCSVTHRAQRDTEKLLAHLRDKYPQKRILALGCLTQKSQIPESNLIQPQGAVPTRTARAYLKIQDGCNCSCTFCIVPTFRGKSRSIPFSEILTTAQKFIASGYHEIVVTGCNMAQYLDNNRRLPELLAALAALTPDCRIRLGSLEPSPVASAVVDVMAETKNICRFLHVPIQSGSDRILSAMKRPYLHKDIDSLIVKAVQRLPGLGLGCDIITGFPGEFETDFLATRTLLKSLPFTKAHIFPYSERPGTPAARFPDVVPPSVRSARAHELAALAQEQRTLYVHRFKGRCVDVIVEDEHGAGWTSEYVWCRFRGTAKRKEWVRVRVLGLDGHILVGERI